MVGLIIGILVFGIPVGLAALVRALRLDGWKKITFAILSVVAMSLCAVALVGTLAPELSKTFVRIFFYSGLGVGIITLLIAIHFLRKKYNKVFTDKTKEHQESVARALKEQEEQNKQ